MFRIRQSLEPCGLSRCQCRWSRPWQRLTRIEDCSEELGGRISGIKNCCLVEGDPLFLIFFNTVLDPLLPELETMEVSFAANNCPVPVLAFPDDLVILDRDKDGLRSMMKRVSRFLTKFG